MRIAIGSDETRPVADHVLRVLRDRGLAVEAFGTLRGEEQPWPDVAADVAEAVASGRCDQGILFCWTGTGVSIAANKIPGVRAALCTDAETARGARRWNDANVLCLSLRLISTSVAEEILDAWFSSSLDESERDNVARLARLERNARSSQARRETVAD